MKKQQAFTLIELTIITIIIGLLLTTVTAGVKLVNQSEINSYGRDLTQIKTGFSVFRDKYEAYPGDMKNADSYWSTTGNGNGNGTIDNADTGNGEEWMRAWEQMSLSGVIPQGLTYSTHATAVIGVNRYQLKSFPDRVVQFEDNVSVIYGRFNLHRVGTYHYSIKIAKAIDKKFDDGKASSGDIISLRPSAGVDQCVDADWTASSANFKTNDATIKCRIWNYMDI